MAGEVVRLEGAKEFRAALRAMGDDLDDLKGAHGEAAELVARRAAVIAPRRSGMLADSIRSSGTKTGGRVRAGGMRNGVIYAGPIHFGSPSGWPPDGFGGFGKGELLPQPFIYDALDERRAEVVDVYFARTKQIARLRGLT